jgi:2-iminoacetate synthase ThiH
VYVSIGHVRELQERNRRSLATMLEINRFARLQSSQNPHQPFWMLTLSLGIAMTRAALEWGDSALNELSSMETHNPARSQKAGARHAAKES